MAFEYPSVLDNMKEFPAIYNMNDKINPALDAENLELDLFVLTATEAGIKRREEEYGINPKDTDTMADRRFKILVHENERLPYTEKFLREKISNLCGDEYSLDVTTEEVIVKLFLERKSYYEAIGEMLEKTVPLNLIINLSLLYNTYENLSKLTYGEMSTYTYQQLRDEVL